MSLYQRFHEIADNPLAYARAWKEKTGGKVIGHFCTYTPEEFVTAAGALPFRLFGSTEDISMADAHIQAYACSLVRGGLEDALRGRLDFLDATIFPHTCDSIQRLSDIWRLNAGIKNHFDVILPVQIDTESSRDYFIDVLKKFRSEFQEKMGVEITDSALRETASLYNDVRGSLRSLYSLRSEYPSLIAGRDMNAVVKASMIMEKKEFLQEVNSLLAALEGAEKETSSSKKRVVITGGICNTPEIYSLLDELGAVVVWDDLCTGSRYFEGTISTKGDPVEAIGTRYLERSLCPAKHRGNTSRGEGLVEMVKQHNAEGVIFMFLKFCDPQGFDYPYMKEYLDKAKIPSMLLEIEEQLPSTGQLQTRFETFIDML